MYISQKMKSIDVFFCFWMLLLLASAVKDQFTVKELTSGTPAGGGGKPALDRARLVAAKRTGKSLMFYSIAVTSFSNALNITPFLQKNVWKVIKVIANTNIFLIAYNRFIF